MMKNREKEIALEILDNLTPQTREAWLGRSNLHSWVTLLSHKVGEAALFTELGNRLELRKKLVDLATICIGQIALLDSLEAEKSDTEKQWTFLWDKPSEPKQ